MNRRTSSPVKLGFEKTSLLIDVADIQPLRIVGASLKRTAKYAQIVASIREVGIIEHPVVARDKAVRGKYLASRRPSPA